MLSLGRARGAASMQGFNNHVFGGRGGGASSMQSFDWWWAFGFVGRGVLFFCWGVGASSMQGLDWQGVRGVVAGLFFQTRSAFSRLQKYGHQIGLKSMCAGVCGGGGGV